MFTHISQQFSTCTPPIGHHEPTSKHPVAEEGIVAQISRFTETISTPPRTKDSTSCLIGILGNQEIKLDACHDGKIWKNVSLLKKPQKNHSIHIVKPWPSTAASAGSGDSLDPVDVLFSVACVRNRTRQALRSRFFPMFNHIMTISWPFQRILNEISSRTAEHGENIAETGRWQNSPWWRQLAGGWKAPGGVRSGPASSAPPPNHQRFPVLRTMKHLLNLVPTTSNAPNKTKPWQWQILGNCEVAIMPKPYSDLTVNILNILNIDRSRRILLKVTHLLPCFFCTLFQLFLSFLGLFDLKQMRTAADMKPRQMNLDLCFQTSSLLAAVLQQLLTPYRFTCHILPLIDDPRPEASTTRSSSSIFCRLAFSSSFSDSSASWRFLHFSWINATDATGQTNTPWTWLAVSQK